MGELTEAFRFHYTHGGWCESETNGRATCAMAMARAEVEAKARGITFRWEPERESLDSVFGKADCCERAERRQAWERANGKRVIIHWHDCECCVAYLGSEHLTSLGMIDGADRDYRRVIEAELASEALHILDERMAYEGSEVQ